MVSANTTAAVNGTTDISSSDNVYVILTAVASGLSIVGGSCICALFVAFKDMRTPVRKLLLFLAISDTLLATGNFLGVIWYVYRDSDVINRSKGFCVFQSALTIYFSSTSFFWTVSMAISLFATVVLGKTSFAATYMKLFHLLAWLPPGVLIIVALSLDVLGTDTSLTEPSWCWIDTRVKYPLLWQFAGVKLWEIVAYITTVVLYAMVKVSLRKRNICKIWKKSETLLWQFAGVKLWEIVAYLTTVVLYAMVKVSLRKRNICKFRLKFGDLKETLLWQFAGVKLWEIVAYITTVVLYAMVKVSLRKRAIKSRELVNRKKSRRDVIVEASRKLTFVPLVFIICRIWGTLRFLLGNFEKRHINEPYVTWINPLQGIGDSIQGFANFIIYCYSLKRIRQRVGRYFCPTWFREDTDHTHTDGETNIRGMKKSKVDVMKPETSKSGANVGQTTSESQA